MINSLNNDLLIRIANNLDNQSCCQRSQLEIFSLTDKYVNKILKNKIKYDNIYQNKNIHELFKSKNSKNLCTKHGIFNKDEYNTLITAFSNLNNKAMFGTIGIDTDDKVFIHMQSSEQMDTLIKKYSDNTEKLHFIICKNRCCEGKGTSLIYNKY